MLQRTMTDSFIRFQGLMLMFFWVSVNCQDPVQGYIAENATLSCNFEQTLVQTDKIFWRDSNDLIVLDIIGGVPKSEKQDEKYKDRVSFLQDSYNNGIVSINIKNLQLGDAGTYTCRLLPARVKEVKLRVSEKPAIKTATDPSGGAAGTKVLGVTLLSALSLLLCF